jgi:hypothetical protein
MAANTPTVAWSYQGSQSGAFVDLVTFTRSATRLCIENTHPTVNIGATYSSSGTPADPVAPAAGVADQLYIPAGAFRSYPLEQAIGKVKLIGTGMTYVVYVV